MNQGNVNVNQNNVNNSGQVINNQINSNINNNITNNNVNKEATTVIEPKVNNTFTSTPNIQTPVQTPVVNTVKPQQTNIQNKETVIAPTQTIINTGNKRTSSIGWFILIILIGAFIYFIDDILAYFNQSFSPVIKNEVTESGEANLVDGYIKIDTTNSYIKLKSIRFNNVKKSTNNSVYITYISDKNYTASLPLGIVIELYNQNKEKIYSEDFNAYGSIEANVSRQYKLNLEESIYNDAYYCLIKLK